MPTIQLRKSAFFAVRRQQEALLCRSKLQNSICGISGNSRRHFASLQTSKTSSSSSHPIRTQPKVYKKEYRVGSHRMADISAALNSSHLDDVQHQQQSQNQPPYTKNIENHIEKDDKNEVKLLNPKVDFNDAQIAYKSKKTSELLRAFVSFGLCRIPLLVKHADGMLRLTRRIFGDTITDAALKLTLFGHFCAGEDERKIQPIIQALQKAGIGSILDFAAEDDGTHSVAANSKVEHANKTVGNNINDWNSLAKVESSSSQHENAAYEILSDNVPIVRLYDYESEAICDRHVSIFKKCIRDVADLQSDGYTAVKVTALGNPQLLERMSRAIVEAQNLFAKFDHNNDGVITRDEFIHGYNVFFKQDEHKLKNLMDQLVDDRGLVDYISWSMLLTPHDLPSITSGCREVGPLLMATPTDEEVELIESMFARGHALAREAASVGTRLLIDAEQTRFQPAIDNLVLNLQRNFNSRSESDFPVIYNTYQCYLKDVPARLRTDLERSERFEYHFGAKLVRGAYMESERALAKSMGYPSPIFDTLEETHDCYNSSVDFLLEKAATGDQKLEFMLASHNQESIEKAIVAMNKYGIDRRDSTICFAQLFGMKDHLTFQLGQNGYRAYKYVPYGEVKMVMPYLIRRANENSSIAQGAGDELQMIRQELMRRMIPGRA